MNNYYLGFKYKGDVNIIVLTANQLANELLGDTDDIIEFKYSTKPSKKEPQALVQRMYINDAYYYVEIDNQDPHCVQISKCIVEFNPEGEEEYVGGEVIERGIPWICVKITDSDNNIIYNLCDER